LLLLLFQLRVRIQFNFISAFESHGIVIEWSVKFFILLSLSINSSIHGDSTATMLLSILSLFLALVFSTAAALFPSSPRLVRHVLFLIVTSLLASWRLHFAHSKIIPWHKAFLVLRIQHNGPA
jgi:hypothetical protein